MKRVQRGSVLCTHKLKQFFFLVGFLNSKHRFVQEKPKPWCRDCGASPAVRAGLLRSEPR